MSEINIYAITLEKDKYFIYCDLNIENNTEMNKVMQQCEYMYDFVKKYKPISVTVIDTIDYYEKYDKNFEKYDKNILCFFDDNDEYYLPSILKMFLSKNLLKIDYHVKRYMIEHGISNVRGGTYYEENLPSYLKDALDQELNSVMNIYSNNTELLQDIDKIIKKLDSNDLITDKIVYLEKRLNKFNNIKERHYELKYFVNNNIQYVINNQIIVDINVLRNKILNKECNNSYRDYNEIIMHLKEIVSKIIIHYGDLQYENKEHLYNPNLIFDKYFYGFNSNGNIEMNENDKYALKLCDNFENLYISLQNRIDEYEFDLSLYNENFEKQINILLYHYGKTKNNYD